MRRLWIIFVLLWVACSPRESTLEIFINRSPLGEEEPLEPSLVSYLSIQVSGGGMPLEQGVFLYATGGSSTLPAIKTGKGRIVTVEGLSDINGYVISRGRSLPLEIKEDHHRMSLFVARVDRFSLTPEYGLHQGRFAHSAVLTDQGQLIVIAGAASGTVAAFGDQLASVEVYDPTSGSTQIYSCESEGTGTCLEHPRAGAAAVKTDRGVLILGGAGPDGFLKTVELLDVGSMKVRRWDEGEAIERADATVLNFETFSIIAGGRNDVQAALDAVELVGRDGSIHKASLPADRVAMAGAAASGYGILFGGFDAQGNVSSDVYLFDIDKAEFELVPMGGEGRAFAGAVSLTDGRIVILGGLDENGVASDEVDLYTPENNRICPVGRMLKARWHAAASLLPDGRILVAGGLIGSEPGMPTDEVEAVDVRYIETDEDCAIVQGQLTSQRLTKTRYRRYAATSITTLNRTVVIVGGLGPTGQPIKEMEIYLPPMI